MKTNRKETILQDEELLNRFLRTGDKAFASTLLNRHIDSVRALIYSMIQNTAETDDLAQDVFLKVIRSAAQFKGESKFKTWLCRIAVNTVLMHLRNRRKWLAQTEISHDLPDNKNAVADSMSDGEFDRAISNALANLQPDYRMAFVLVHAQEHSPMEAAEIIGCSLSTLNWRLHKAKTELQKHMGPFISED